MKKILSLLLALLLTVSVSGALASEVSVAYSNEFQSRLGIFFDADLLAEQVKLSVVNDSIGQVRFELKNVNGEKIPWTVRFTAAENYTSPRKLSGAKNGDFSCPLELGVRGVKMTIYQSAEGTDVYTWAIGNARFSLTVEGVYSNNQFSAVMDRILEACGK